jgi:hypothetical protein
MSELFKNYVENKKCLDKNRLLSFVYDMTFVYNMIYKYNNKINKYSL